MNDPVFGKFKISEQEELRKKLNEGIVVVAFKTAKDDVRVMRATTSPGLIPVTLQSTIVKENTDQNLFKVFDLVKQEWRSFRFERIITSGEEKVVFEVPNIKI